MTFHASNLRPVLRPLALCLAFVSNAGFAQQSTGADAPVLVTATRFAQAPADVLADNNVISSDEIRGSGATDLLDLLRQKRGLEITTTGGAGTTASVLLRGASSEQTVVLVDGVRVGSSTMGGATWENIPLSQIDHVEIVYGPLSSMYGADAVGGVVQIFTKKGDGAFNPSAGVGFGGYDTRTVDAAVSGSGGEQNRFHYSLSVGRDESKGFSATKPDAPFGAYNPDRDGYNKESASGQFSFDLAKGHEIGAAFVQSENKAQFDNGPNYDDHTFERLNTVRVFANDQFTPNWNSRLQLSQSIDYALSTNGPNWEAYGETPTNRFQTTQTDLSWQNDIQLAGNILQLLGERREEKVDSDTSGVQGKRDTNAFAAAYQWKSDNQLAALSLRDDDSNQYGSQTTGSFAYGYRVAPNWRVNASYGTSFRAPTFNELYFPYYGSPDIKPEHGRNTELGLVYDNGGSHFNASLYHNRVTDLIVYDSTCFCAKNVDDALLEGLTLGGKSRFGDFTASASLDFQDPHDETTHTLLARRARQHGSLGLDYVHGKYAVGVDAVISGKRYDDQANTTVLGGYSVWNLHAAIDLGSEWSMVARWNNVLNKDYELAYGYNTPGSNLYLGLRYGFK
ncbi:MAG TPA: TonB-dependent receptor [Burkholderiaceae bacterium]